MKRINQDEVAGMALLHDFGYNYSEIAEMWGVSYSAVRTRMQVRNGADRPWGDRTENYNRDVAEVRVYLANHPDATVFDVALELHFTDDTARRMMKVRA